MNLFDYLFNNYQIVLQRTSEHIIVFLISWSASVLIGLLIGILITREKMQKYTNFVLTLSSIAQSIPSVAIIALVFLFFGIGKLTAIFSLFIYSLVPVIFNTASGIINIDKTIIEVAEGMGMSKKEILFKVELLIALPTIFSGIRNSAVINIATATVAAVIGGGGLGVIIFTGLAHYNVSIIFAGVLPVSILAITIDSILAILEKKLVSKGLLYEEGKL
ncbi:MAG: ABC transporter permease [Thermosipho sp. (in: Bacteria)]|nr:ABC transporter permease [Thermosipho sp. (in: thermotogales)]